MPAFSISIAPWTLRFVQARAVRQVLTALDFLILLQVPGIVFSLFEVVMEF